MIKPKKRMGSSPDVHGDDSQGIGHSHGISGSACQNRHDVKDLECIQDDKISSDGDVRRLYQKSCSRLWKFQVKKERTINA